MRTLLTLLLVLCAVPAWAADHCVRSGATGTGTGADWTNAYTALPATLTRGDTYYIAGGTYAAYTFDDSASSTTLITIKKATASAHGPATGWDAAYGTTEAAWGEVAFTTSYWVFDGATGGGPGAWTTGFGFTFTSAATSNLNYVTLADGVTNITVRHASFVQTGDIVNNNAVNAVYNNGAMVDTLFEYLYVNNITALPFLLRNGSGNIIQYVYTGDICGRSDFNVNNHCEAVVVWGMDDLHFRWNYVAECPSSGGFVKNADDVTAGGPSEDVRIYGNIFRNGVPIQCNSGTCADWRVFNNTFATSVSYPIGAAGTWTGLLNYNNIFYDGSASSIQGTHGYNWFSSATTSCTMNENATENICNGCSGGCDAVTETADPFVNASGTTPEDLRLTAPISGWSGTNPCAISEACTGEIKYHLDMFGTARSGDYTRGAIQYGSLPSAPTNVRIR